MISVVNLGRCDYGTALRLQERLVELRKQERVGNVLLFVEHDPVITLGRNAKEKNIIASPEFLCARGVETFEINRGGDVTFHGPGQLVAYPIVDLRSLTPKIGVIEYVRRLEEVLMRTCAQWAIETQRIAGMTGVWTLPTAPPRLSGRTMGRDYSAEANAASDNEYHPERKIAAIGVHVSRAVTSHGFALNVTTDLSYFQLIVPCGLTKPVTSIEFETGARPPLEDVMTVASRCFGEIYQSQMLWLESLDDLLPGASEQDMPARAPEDERRVAADDTHLA